MAGTRLALSVVYLLEIPLLVYFAISYAIQNSKNYKTKWYPTNQPFVPHRDGISILNKHDTKSTITEMRSSVNNQDFGIEVDFNLRFFGDGASENSALYEALVDGVDERDLDTAFVRSKVQYKQDEIEMFPLGCHDSNIETMLDDETNQDGLTYDIFVASDCEESTVHISDHGNLYVRLENGIAAEDVRSIFKDDVSFLIQKLVHNTAIDGWKPKLAHRLLISVVDSDPASHYTQYQNAIQHSHRINEVLTDALDEMQPLVAKFSELVNITLSTQNLPYYGRDLTYYATRHEYESGAEDFILSRSDAQEILLRGDLSFLTQGSASPDISENMNEEIVPLILYVPEKERRPLFIGSGDKWSTSFFMPGRNLGFATVNLPDVEASNDTDHKALEGVYKYEVQSALSYLAAFLRHYFHLPPQQPHLEDSDFKYLSANHERTHAGAATWEIESLMRKTIPLKVEITLSTLEQTHSLIVQRPGIALTNELAIKMLHCTNVLNRAIALIRDGGDIREITPLLNEAVNLAMAIREDDETFEMPYAPYDQLFAIFGSLLIPLFVPLLKNIISETKRYVRKVKTA